MGIIGIKLAFKEETLKVIWEVLEFYLYYNGFNLLI